MKRLASALLVAAAALLAAMPAAHAADTYAQTRHPIVLVHGLFGFDAIGPVDYFYGMPAALRTSGATVYVPQQAATNTSELRGEQLLAQLRQLKAAYGHTKFHLIAHSHGGHTSRYVAGVAPELVASITTLNTPHMGSKTADGIEAGTSATGTTAAVAAIVNAFSKFIDWMSTGGNPQDSLGALASLNTKGALAFNARFPAGAPTSACGQGPAVAGNGVRYYSVGGTSVVTNVLDLIDPVLAAGSVFYGFEANDGVVGRCSSRWGTVLRDNYPWNHFDVVNQTFGLRGLFTPDPVAMVRSQANRLKLLGL